MNSYCLIAGRRGSLMVTALDSGSSSPSSSPGCGHCVEFLGKTLYSHSASLHPGVYMGTGEWWVSNLAMEIFSHVGKSKKYFQSLYATENGLSSDLIIVWLNAWRNASCVLVLQQVP